MGANRTSWAEERYAESHATGIMDEHGEWKRTCLLFLNSLNKIREWPESSLAVRGMMQRVGGREVRRS